MYRCRRMPSFWHSKVLYAVPVFTTLAFVQQIISSVILVQQKFKFAAECRFVDR